MLSFLAGDADVLVSTTIIESGLDIPQANTLIVERADALGLAQLYQIRGRVGRSDVTAHAYLFYPDGEELTPEARARLAALADHTELGAGFQIAMRDLEIRGAGDLLGAEQSGPRRGDRLRALPRAARRGGRRALRHAPPDRAPGPGRGAGRRVRPGRLHRRRGAEDRPPPAARARRVRGRAARAARGDRGPLRPAARAGREPVRDPGGEAEARAARRRLPRPAGREGDGRARSCSARTSCASCAGRPTRPCTRRPARRSRRGATVSPPPLRCSMLSSAYGWPRRRPFLPNGTHANSLHPRSRAACSRSPRSWPSWRSVPAAATTRPRRSGGRDRGRRRHRGPEGPSSTT